MGGARQEGTAGARAGDAAAGFCMMYADALPPSVPCDYHACIVWLAETALPYECRDNHKC